MKILTIFILLPLCSNAFGDGPNKTEQSYSAFCEKGAADSMDKLNQNTKDLLADIETKRKNVNDLIAQKTIFSDLMKLKSDYYNALESVDNSRDLSRKEMKSNIDNFRNLLRTSLTMSAVKYMLKKAPNASSVKSMSDICQNEEFKSTDICQK
jgi:succinylglutamate desuccinylase